MDTPRYTSASLSPDGRHLALTGGRGGERQTLFVIDLEAPQPAARQTRASEGDVVRVHWLGAVQLLFSVDDLETPVNQRMLSDGAFTVGLQGGWPRRLMDAPMPLLFVVPQVAVAPADRRVIVADLQRRSQRGQPRLPYLRPHWLDLDSRLARPMALPGAPDQVVHWLFDPHGQPRLAMTEDDEGLRRLFVQCARCGTPQAVWLVDSRADTEPGERWVRRAAGGSAPGGTPPAADRGRAHGTAGL